MSPPRDRKGSVFSRINASGRFSTQRIPWQGTLPLTGVQVYCFHAVPGNLYSPVTEVRFIFIIFPEVKSPLEFDLSGFAYLIKRDEKNVFNVFL